MLGGAGVHSHNVVVSATDFQNMNKYERAKFHSMTDPLHLFTVNKFTNSDIMTHC